MFYTKFYYCVSFWRQHRILLTKSSFNVFLRLINMSDEQKEHYDYTIQMSNPNQMTQSPLWNHGRHTSRSLVDPKVVIANGPGLSILEERINSIYSEWDKAGLVQLTNKDEMANAATALALHQFTQKYPLKIGPDPTIYSRAVTTQTLLPQCQKGAAKDDGRLSRTLQEPHARQLGQAIGLQR